MNKLAAKLKSLGNPRLLVVGDLILDRYTWGQVDRISPEAPVMVLNVEQEEVRLGGAASVAALLRGLDAEVTLAGVVGEDGSGRALRRLCEETGIQASSVLADPGRPTTVKDRFMGQAPHRHAQQMLRVDWESKAPLPAELETQLLQSLLPQVCHHGAILISDYAKGVCSRSLIRSLTEAAHHHGIPVLVDPARRPNYYRYRGVTLLTPNRPEAATAVGRDIHGPDDAVLAAKKLQETLATPLVLIKLDSQGMVLVEEDQPPLILPAVASEVADVTGAGDMVLAMMGLARAAGCGWSEAAQLANLAAGLEVQNWGVSPVTRAEVLAEMAAASEVQPAKILTLPDLTHQVEKYRRAGRKIVFTNGCFDLLHVGHVAYLEEAARRGDVLIVAVNADQTVRRLKGPERPILADVDRAAMLAALSCVDHVVIFAEETPHRLLRALRPDVLVKGGTYTPEEVVGKEVVAEYGGAVCVTGRVNGISTSTLVSRVRKSLLLTA
jgi:D-beta-D-heptose 7-phosphate kinase/D-beta-D-heptose 1-phosphate adenosyltransferase